MPRKQSKLSPSELHQTPDTWGVGTFLLRQWLVDDDPDIPARPTLILVLDLDHGYIMASSLINHAPSAEEIRDTLFKAMTKPMKMCGEPRRPTLLFCHSAGLGEAIEPYMDELGIHCEPRAIPGIDDILEEMAQFMDEEEDHPSLIDIEGATLDIVGKFFETAAKFYRAAPWVQMLNEQFLLLRIPAEGGLERFVTVMGNGGVEYGLAFYESWHDVENLFKNQDDPLNALPAQGALSMLYERAHQMSFDDLDAIEANDWDVVDEQSYPSPIYFHRTEEARRPTLAELQWIEAALRAIPLIVNDHLRPDNKGDFAPLETTISVPTSRGEVTVSVKYPAGTLHHENFPASNSVDAWDEKGNPIEEPPIFDRRLMEKSLLDVFGDMLGNTSGDPKLRKAQDIMYQAFEETNPAKRISLAHKALKTSDKCADAFVLLAEEQADTVARALEYYQKGVDAGERALGNDYFKEAVGHFWGIMETRPYMRARAGLAECLIKLNQVDGAVEHYRDMLRLNPNDNQGLRYIVAEVLLDQNRDAELIKLLKQYKDDAMAEWLYTWALAAFRKNSKSKEADKRLRGALEQNPFVPDYLTGKKRVPLNLPPTMGWGDEQEAIHYAAKFLNHWRRTPGAIDWMKDHL